MRSGDTASSWRTAFATSGGYERAFQPVAFLSEARAKRVSAARVAGRTVGEPSSLIAPATIASASFGTVWPFFSDAE